MEWWKQPCWFLDSEQFLGCVALDQAIWLRLMRFCVGQENNGVIVDCRTWGEQRWKCVARISVRNVRRSCALWTWRGDDLVVAGYPTESQAECIKRRTASNTSSSARAAAARHNGGRGGRPPSQRSTGTVPVAALEAPESASPERAARSDTVLQLPPEQLLGTWIRWLGNDPERQEANRQELRQLVALHGLRAVQAQAERLAHAVGGKVYPNELSDAFIAARNGSRNSSDPAAGEATSAAQVLRLPPRRAR